LYVCVEYIVLLLLLLLLRPDPSSLNPSLKPAPAPPPLWLFIEGIEGITFNPFYRYLGY
jgi:hypothetical protein